MKLAKVCLFDKLPFEATMKFHTCYMFHRLIQATSRAFDQKLENAEQILRNNSTVSQNCFNFHVLYHKFQDFYGIETMEIYKGTDETVAFIHGR
jgi:hypothetical protein